MEYSAVIQKVVVVLPTYNERGTIVQVIDGIFDAFSGIVGVLPEIVVVDDTSPDGTGELVESMQIRYSGLFLVRGKKQGIGKAYQRGIAYAITERHADWVVQMDSDLSHNPADLPRLFAATQSGADVVIGSRYVSGGSIDDSWGPRRRFLSKAGNQVSRTLLRIPVKDATSGYRFLRSDLLQKAQVDAITATGYGFIIAILQRVHLAGGTIAEVPIHFTERVAGASKMGMREVVRYATAITALRAEEAKIKRARK